MEKILIVGISGAGKSTVATQMGQALDIPVIHLDKYFWKAGWKLPELDEWNGRLAQLSDAPKWIIDGNYSSSYEVLMPRSDTIVCLTISRSVAIYRVVKRVVLRKLGRFSIQDVPANCRAQLDWKFIKYIWRFPVDRQPQLDAAIEKFGKDRTVLRLDNVTQVRRFIESLTNEPNTRK